MAECIDAISVQLQCTPADIIIVSEQRRDSRKNVIVMQKSKKEKFFIKISIIANKEKVKHEYAVGKALVELGFENHIVPPFLFFETDSYAGIIFHFVECQSMHDLIPESISDEILVDGLKGILHIYESFHWSSIPVGAFSHGDLHKRQVVKTVDGRFLLCDFANSRLKFQNNFFGTNASSRPVEDEIVVLMNIFLRVASEDLSSKLSRIAFKLVKCSMSIQDIRNNL